MAEHMRTINSIPPELKDAVKPALHRLIKLCPPWVNTLIIDFEQSPTNTDKMTTLAELRADYKYRRAYLTIHPAWLSLSDDERVHNLIHEAIHILHAPVQQMFQETLDALITNDKTRALVQAQWNIANEAFTEDTAVILLEQAGYHVRSQEEEEHETETS